MRNLTALSVFLACGSCFCQLAGFPGDFSEQAFQHVEKLCSFGQRGSDAKARAETVDYLSAEFRKLGLETAIEPFTYKSFESKTIKLMAGGKEYKAVRFFINPYAPDSIKGSALFLDKDSSLKKVYENNLTDRIALMTQAVNRYQLMARKPRALVVVADSIYQRLDRSDDSKVEISAAGTIVLQKSANIIGVLGPERGNEIIISAHWDSFDGPGASDNASGVGVMLELANYFSSTKPGCTIRFVSFGAEELGCLGAKAYAIRHKNELKKCTMAFNIDEVGGYKDVYIEMRGGVRDLPKENEFDFDVTRANLAITDSHHGWFLTNSGMSASNVPDWLTKAIDESCRELKIEYIPANEMGSDHQVLFQSGVVATNICCYGDNKTHCPEDLPDQVNKTGLEKAGKIVALTVEKAMNHK